MSGDWEVIEPTFSPNSASAAQTPVRISVGEKDGGKGMRRRVTLTVDPRQITDVEWLKAGEPISIALGRGEFAGRVRITHGGGMRIVKATARGTSRLQINSPDLLTRLIVPAGRHADFVETDWAPGWVEIKLPVWAKRRVEAGVVDGPALSAAIDARPPVAIPEAVPGKTPFRGLASRTGIGSVAGRPSAPLPTGTGPGRQE